MILATIYTVASRIIITKRMSDYVYLIVGLAIFFGLVYLFRKDHISLTSILDYTVSPY